MTDEELDQWRGQEAWRLRHEYPEDATEVIAARLAREGRTPPEPAVDPDVLAFREWAAKDWVERYPAEVDDVRRGKRDGCDIAKAYLAGARMAREQERERAKVLVECVERYAGPHAAMAIAKYQGEA